MQATEQSLETPLQEAISLEGQTAIVTGAAMGIGRAIATRLHQAGANIVIADPDESRTEIQEMLCAERSESALSVDTDVSQEDSVHRMIQQTMEQFGSIDVLINNAGIFPSAPVLEMDHQLFRRVLDVNLTGLFLCAQAAARQMVDQNCSGRIVNITSIDAIHPSAVGLAHYDASKHGAWGFTENCALELAPYGIRVNAIAPGGIKTPGTEFGDQEALAEFEKKIPMGRMGRADEIGLAALFLASEMSSYMTGSQIVVDGGRLLG